MVDHLIRPATPADVPAVLPMVEAICSMHHALDPRRYDFLPDVVDRYRAWLPQRATDPRSVFLVGLADPHTPRAIAGFLVATIEPNIPIYTPLEFGFIHDVWVEPSHRGRGLAGAMVAQCLRRFEALGVEQVRLETATANESARRLFSRHGFRTTTHDMLWSR